MTSVRLCNGKGYDRWIYISACIVRRSYHRSHTLESLRAALRTLAQVVWQPSTLRDHLGPLLILQCISVSGSGDEHTGLSMIRPLCVQIFLALAMPRFKHVNISDA